MSEESARCRTPTRGTRVQRESSHVAVQRLSIHLETVPNVSRQQVRVFLDGTLSGRRRVHRLTEEPLPRRPYSSVHDVMRSRGTGVSSRTRLHIQRPEARELVVGQSRIHQDGKRCEHCFCSCDSNLFCVI
jgi:hypothetical protein